MDNSETLSDCSESSRASENLFSSNASTFSDLSGYEGEFLRLKQTIDQNKVDGESKLGRIKFTLGNGLQYGTNIQNLQTQLQNLKKQNERYKIDISNLEKKISLSYNAKIEKLLERNCHLEENLKSASSHIQRLINIYSNRSHYHDNIMSIERQKLNVEANNFDLNLQNSVLSNKLAQCSHQKNEIENDYKALKIQFNELMLELTAKEKCVSGLKGKILEQHMELQANSQHNIKLSHTVTSLSNELQHARKSENWYKKELNQLQIEKNNIMNDIVKKDIKIGKLNLELNEYKCKCEEMQYALLKQKGLLKPIETVANDQINSNYPIEINKCCHETDNQSNINYYEIRIKDLTNELSNIKFNFENQQNSVDELIKQNSEISTKCLALENRLKDKINMISKLEKDKEDFRVKLADVLNKVQEYTTKILHLESINVELETELTVKSEEKYGIEKTIKTIKEQFQVLKNKYEGLKEELSLKDKEVLQLLSEKKELLCTYNNEKTNDLEKIRLKDNEIKELQEKLCVVTKNIIDLQLEICNKEKEYENAIEKKNYSEKNSKQVEVDYLSISQDHQKNFQETRDTSNTIQYLGTNDTLDTLVSFKENNDVNDEFINDNVMNFEMSTKLIVNTVKNNITKFIVKDYANLDAVSVNVTYILEYICKLCRIKDYAKFLQTYFCSIGDKNPENIKILLNKIDKHLHAVGELTYLKNNRGINLITDSTVYRVNELEHKCMNLENKAEENENLVLKFPQQGNRDEEIKHLQALLEVKLREQKDKQKSYETNYRTLLRKVKEHMKGRNIAEKRNLHLQELCNNLSNECNVLRLQIRLNENALESVKNHENLQNSKNNLPLFKHCENCIGLGLVKESELDLQQSLQICECFKGKLLQAIKMKTESTASLKKENQELLFKMANLNNEFKSSVDKIETLIESNKQITTNLENQETVLSEVQTIKEKIEFELSQEKEKLLSIHVEINGLHKRVELITERNICLMNELEFITSCIRQKDDELRELNLKQEQLEKVWDKKDNNMQNIVTSLKYQLYLFTNEIDKLKREKYFLQRLCKDLKVALQVHVNHNKAYITCSLSEVKQKWTSVFSIISDFSSSPKYNDNYIDNLCQANSIPMAETPVGEIQDCFDVLRKEINNLQKQIIEKNVGL